MLGVQATSVNWGKEIYESIPVIKIDRLTAYIQNKLNRNPILIFDLKFTYYTNVAKKIFCHTKKMLVSFLYSSCI